MEYNMKNLPNTSLYDVIILTLLEFIYKYNNINIVH